MVKAVRTPRVRKRRSLTAALLGILASIVAHSVVLLMLMQFRVPSRDRLAPLPTRSVRINVLPTPSGKKVAPLEELRPTAKTAEQLPTTVKREQKSAKPTSTASSPASFKTPAIERYDQLLPKVGLSYPVADSENEVTSDIKGHGLPGFDPENDSIPFDKRIRNLSKLTQFARDLAELIAVPPALWKIESRGAAHVRFTRKGSSWKVTGASGDPYFRAILYETLASLSPKTYGLVILAESEFDTVRIYFEFRTIATVDQTTKPVDVSIDGNKIFIVMTRQYDDPKWQMLMGSPTGMPTINLLGAGWVLARPYIEANPHEDIEIKKLQLSPAFVRPIGR